MTESFLMVFYIFIYDVMFVSKFHYKQKFKQKIKKTHCIRRTFLMFCSCVHGIFHYKQKFKQKIKKTHCIRRTFLMFCSCVHGIFHYKQTFTQKKCIILNYQRNSGSFYKIDKLQCLNMRTNLWYIFKLYQGETMSISTNFTIIRFTIEPRTFSSEPVWNQSKGCL